MLDIVFRNSTSDTKYNSKFFEKILLNGVRELKLGNKDIEVSVNIVEGDRIRELNNKYRHKDKVTDVLSFPLETKPAESSKIWPIGDIFICLSFAKNEAKSENISIEDKLAQLAVHGFLHLLGYDHEKSKEEENMMLDLEKKILNKLKL